MKTKIFQWTFVFGLTILFSIVSFPQKSHSQPSRIREVKFELVPQTPQSILKLHISFSGSDTMEKEVSIVLIAWKDLDNDCQWTEPQEVELLEIKLKDNEKGKDESQAKDEIVAAIGKIPKNHPHQKYAVRVICGKDNVEKSINYPSTGMPDCNRNSRYANLDFFSKIHNWWKDVREKQRSLPKTLREGGAHKEYQERDGLYVYNLKEKKVDKIVHNPETSYHAPTWSFDSAKLTFVINNGGNEEIAWTDLGQKNLRLVTQGYIDRTPFWFPDNIHIIFIRNTNLQIVNTLSRELKPISAKIPPIDQILGVFKQGERNTLQVFLEGSNRHFQELKEVYMLELDGWFMPEGDVSHLVDNLIWFFIPGISPSGYSVVYRGEDNGLFIKKKRQEKPERIFKKEYGYYLNFAPKLFFETTFL